MIKVEELFTAVYGVNLEYDKMVEKKNGIPFVSTGSQNNGVMGYVKEIEGLQPNPANTISLAANGSIMESFLQEEEYYSGRDVYYLEPKVSLTKNQMLYYCMILRHNKYRYSYGRKANRTLKFIRIPPPDEVPEYVNKITIAKPSSEPKRAKKISMHDRSWEWFKYNDLFEIKKGERLTKEYRDIGDIPLCTSKAENNGIATKISRSRYIDSKKLFENKITIDMFNNVFYHGYEYFSDDNVHTLINKNETNIYIDLFIATVAKIDKYRYAYGRQVRLSRLEEQFIKLPAKKKSNGKPEPDWQFMEDYMKSLPYSSNL